jgi:hypothetical protein
MCVPGTRETVRAALEADEQPQGGLSRRAALAAGAGALAAGLMPGRARRDGLGLLRADKVGIENLANLDQLPRRGATVVMGLIPWKEGSGGPARVLATY